jgi:hypothetical protein
MRNETLVTAAMIAARDGGAELIAKHEEGIRETFLRALKGTNDPVHRVRAGLQFNPIAIAFAGMVLLLKNRFAMEDVRTLLESALTTTQPPLTVSRLPPDCSQRSMNVCRARCCAALLPHAQRRTATGGSRKLNITRVLSFPGKK